METCERGKFIVRWHTPEGDIIQRFKLEFLSLTGAQRQFDIERERVWTRNNTLAQLNVEVLVDGAPYTELTLDSYVEG